MSHHHVAAVAELVEPREAFEVGGLHSSVVAPEGREEVGRERELEDEVPELPGLHRGSVVVQDAEVIAWHRQRRRSCLFRWNPFDSQSEPLKAMHLLSIVLCFYWMRLYNVHKWKSFNRGKKGERGNTGKGP